MNITEAIDALRPFTSKAPIEALNYIRSNWSEAEPILIKAIDARLDMAMEDDTDALFDYALYLCAEMRSHEAFTRYVKLCRLHDPILEHIIGDVLTENMPDMLSRTCYGRVAEIKALIEDNSLDEYARSSALRSLELLMFNGELSREELSEYCVFLLEKGLERKASNIWNTVVYVATEIHADAALPLIEKAYERGLVDTLFDRFDNIIADFEKPVEEILEKSKKRHSRFENAEKEMSFFVKQWKESDFDTRNDDAELLAILRESRKKRDDIRRAASKQPLFGEKISRNAPCPCGSGKKYKRCCLNGTANLAEYSSKSDDIPVLSVNGRPIQEKYIKANDWMEAGYEYRKKYHYNGAFLCWKRCWEEMKILLPPFLTNPSDAEEIGAFEGHDFLSNWIQDFEGLLMDISHKNIVAAKFAIEYFEELLARFPNMDILTRSNIKTDLARLLAILGRHQEAVALLERMIAENPRSAQPYVALAEMFGEDASKYGFALDLPRAIGYLEKALAQAEDCEDYDVALRLDNLRDINADL